MSAFNDRDSDMHLGRRVAEHSGALAGGNRFHVTRERLHITDPSGGPVATIDAAAIQSIRRVGLTVTITGASGEQTEVAAATHHDARHINGILGANAHVRASYVDTPFSGGGAPKWLLLAVGVVLVVVLAICALILVSGGFV